MEKELSSFDHIMRLLKPAREYMTIGRVQACRRLWASFDIERQRLTYCNIQAKLARGEPVNKVPYFAIEDNSYPPEEQKAAEPTNYSGTELGGNMLAAGTAKIAAYKGRYNVYSLEDIELFNLKVANR